MCTSINIVIKALAACSTLVFHSHIRHNAAFLCCSNCKPEYCMCSQKNKIDKGAPQAIP